MKRNSGILGRVLALLFGLVSGSIATYLVIQYKHPPVESGHQMHLNQNPDYDEFPEIMLFPEGTTLQMLYRDKGFFEAIHSADNISIHPVNPNEGHESVKLDGYVFSKKGLVPDKQSVERLKHTLCSINSYEPNGKMCSFNPAVLLRLIKGGIAYDMQFCFTCQQIKSSHDGGADMSEQGMESFLKIFCDTLPNFEVLHEFRRQRALRSRGL